MLVLVLPFFIYVSVEENSPTSISRSLSMIFMRFVTSLFVPDWIAHLQSQLLIHEHLPGVLETKKIRFEWMETLNLVQAGLLSFTGEDSPMASLMLSVMGAFAEFERALIHERQREGLALAKQRGAYRGRKKSLSETAISELQQRLIAGVSKAQVAREFGISRETLYQYLKVAWGCAVVR
jgi:hypothetical protein